MILYAGNILSKYGYTPTFIESLAPKLAEMYDVSTVSEKHNKILRLTDMLLSVKNNRRILSLVLIDSYSMQAFWYTYLLAKMCRSYGIPYIPILRGGGYPDRLKSSQKLCREIFSGSALNISPSLYLKKHFEDYGYKVEYIPNFIPLGNYAFKRREALRPRLFWVRSFHEIYNPVLAVDILYRLKKKFPSAVLCMVGPDKDGSLEKVRKRISELSLADSVEITGKLSKREWIKLSEDYDIFINTTDFDNHPVSVIEAMALGMPVVSSNVGGIPYLVDDGSDGMLAAAGDADDFLGKILRLLDNGDFALQISKRAREKAEGFDWSKVKELWIKAIETSSQEKRKAEINVVA